MGIVGYVTDEAFAQKETPTTYITPDLGKRNFKADYDISNNVVVNIGETSNSVSVSITESGRGLWVAYSGCFSNVGRADVRVTLFFNGKVIHAMFMKTALNDPIQVHIPFNTTLTVGDVFTLTFNFNNGGAANMSRSLLIGYISNS